MTCSTASLGGARAQLRDVREVSDPLIVQLVAAIKAEANKPWNEPLAEALATALAMHLVCHYSVNKGEGCDAERWLGKTRLRAVLDHINEHLGQNISIDALAKTAGLSSSHFIRMFQYATGLSPHQYILRARVLRGQELLRTTRESIAEIAQYHGFCGQSHFTMHFRRVLGVDTKTLSAQCADAEQWRQGRGRFARGLMVIQAGRDPTRGAMGHRALSLWREAVRNPRTVFGARVAEAVVETAGPALPEFDFDGPKAVSHPSSSGMGISSPGKLSFEFAHSLFEEAAVPDHGTLARGQRSRDGCRAAHLEVGFGFFAAEFGDTPNDVDLSFEFDPGKIQCSSRVVLEFGGLADFGSSVKKLKPRSSTPLRRTRRAEGCASAADRSEEPWRWVRGSRLEGLLEPFRRIA
jgi:AraC-like DNA-binding protein